MALPKELEKAITEAEEVQKNKTHTEWGQPIPFENVSLPPFPVEIFPSWLRDYIESVSKATQTPNDLGSLSALSILSIISTNRFKIKVKHSWEESLNLYVMATMESGGGKSRTLKNYRTPLDQYEAEEQEALKVEIAHQEERQKALYKRRDHLSNEYAKKAEKSTLKEIQAITEEIIELEKNKIVSPRFFTSDITAEKLGMLLKEQEEKMALMTAEGGGVIKNIAGKYSNNGTSDIELYLSAYDGEKINIDRVGRQSIQLNEPYLNMCLFVQENIIQSLNRDFMEQGFVQRFIFSLPPSNVGYRNLSDETEYITEEVRTGYHTAIKRLLNRHGELSTLEFTPGANELKRQIIDENEERLKEDGELRESDPLKNWGSRLNQKVFKVAGLLHVSDYALSDSFTPMVSKDTLERARSLIPYMIAHAKATFGVMRSNSKLEDNQYILKRIIDQLKEEIPRRDLYQLVKHRFDTEKLGEVLDELEDRHYIEQAKKGRKQVIYVNPHVLEKGVNI